MGWMFLNPAPLTPKAYLDDQYTYAPDPGKGRHRGLSVLASAMVSHVYYAACQSHDADGPRETFAVICLTKWNPRARDGLTLGSKDMTETMGPYNHGCPARILDLLSPTDNEYAVAWREKCRAQLALTGRRKPAIGDIVILPEPIVFSDRVSESSFTTVEHRARLAFRRKADNRLVRIDNLMKRQWKLIQAASDSR